MILARRKNSLCDRCYAKPSVYLYTSTQRRRFNVARGCTVSVAEFNFRFSARHLVITARASAAQSSSCLLTQSDGANSKFRELLHSRRLYRNFNKSPAPPTAHICTLLARWFSLWRSSWNETVLCAGDMPRIITPNSLCVTAIISYPEEIFNTVYIQYAAISHRLISVLNSVT